MRRNLLWLLSGLLIGVLMAGSGRAEADMKAPPIRVNGTTTDIHASSVNGRFMADVGNLMGYLGVTATWNSDLETIDLVTWDRQVRSAGGSVVYWLDPANQYAWGAYPVAEPFVDRVAITLDSKALIMGPAVFTGLRNGTMTADQVLARSLVANLGDSKNLPKDPTPVPVIVAEPLDPASIPEDSILVADDGTYLGELTGDEYSSKSICNDYGDYGSEYEALSIWNEYGDYGSEYSNESAFNDLASKPPTIISKGKTFAYLTTNSAKNPRVSPYGICEQLRKAGK